MENGMKLKWLKIVGYGLAALVILMGLALIVFAVTTP